jgi:diguanylate cyclase (GGDEF)-like protein
VLSVVSVLFLNLAAGGSTSGTGIVILIPLVWAALYHRRWESFVVVATIVGAEIATGLTPEHLGDAALLRRLVLWSSLGLLISLATHDLRDRLLHTLGESEDSRCRTESLQQAAEQLTTLLDSDEVVTTATRLAAELVSPPGTPGRRSQYTRLVGSMVHPVAQFDELGSLVAPFPLDQHPNLAHVMRTGMALNSPLDHAAAGPLVQRLIGQLGVTDAVYVPVCCHGEIDGVLSVSTRGKAVSSELFECCKALGHLTELALQNAHSHDLLEAMAWTDALTGLANRRAFDQCIAQRPGRLAFSVLLVDVDDLKKANDSLGHAMGDALLSHVARVLEGSVRAGDVVARLGGDEFAVMLFDARDAQGVQTATRILSALASSPAPGRSCDVSIGVASGEADTRGEDVLLAADAAMYRAKQQGGRRYAVAPCTALETAFEWDDTTPRPSRTKAMTRASSFQES